MSIVGHDECGGGARSKVRPENTSASARTETFVVPRIQSSSDPEQCTQGTELTTDAATKTTTSQRVDLSGDGPRHPRFASVDTRINSFIDWPQAMPQRPSQMADAGFFYLGRGDRVQCFYCDGGLKNWEANDDPWEEHAKWFGECAYLTMVRGPEFVQNIKQWANRGQLDYLEDDLDVQMEVDKKAVEALRSPITLSSLPDLRRGRLSDSAYSSFGLDEDDDSDPPPKCQSDLKNLERENRRLREEKLCKICVDREVSVVFVPCGHLACCFNCAPAFTQCPVCRANIKSAIRTFMS